MPHVTLNDHPLPNTMDAARRLFAGPGDVRALARSYDWAASPLGPVERWCEGLRHAARLVLDAPVAMNLWCGPSHALIYNDALVPILGTKHPTAFGRTGGEVLGELWSEMQAQVDSVLGGGMAMALDDMPLSLDRGAAGAVEEGWFTYTISPVYDAPDAPDPHVVAVLCTVTETTARRRAERALDTERDRLRAVVMSAPAPIALHVGAEHRYELVNEAYQRISGDRRLVQGLGVREAFPGVSGDSMFESLDRVRTTGEPLAVSELLIRYDRDGTGPKDCYFNLRFEPVRNAAGEVAAILNFSFDVTDQVHARHEVEAVNRQLKENTSQLERQTKELQRTAAQLEERTRDAESANEAARRSELRMAELFQQAPAFIAVVSGPEHVFEFANDAYHQLVGYRDIIGRRVIDALPEVAEQGFVELLDRVRATGEPFVGREMPIQLVPGPGANPVQRYVTFVYAAVSGVQDTITDIFVHGVDVTEHVLARRALLESERQFRNLADAIPTLAWTARADGHIDWYNARWYEYTGTTPEQMEGWGWQIVHAPDVLPSVLETWRAGLARAEPLEMTIPLRAADGQFRRFLTRVVPVKDGDGRVLRWFGTNTDVEEERIARSAAEAAVTRTRQLQELTADLAAVATLEEVAAVVTTAGKRALGAVSSVLLVADTEAREVIMVGEEGVRHDMRERYSRFSLDAVMPSAEAIRTSQPVMMSTRGELVRRYPGLTEFWMTHNAHAMASVPLTVAGEAIGAMSFTFDAPRAFPPEDIEFLLVIARQAAQAAERARLFTAEREARSAAENANRAKTDFLSTMSHELRTPLNAVAGYAELLSMGLRGPVTEAQLADLGRIRRAGQHLQSLINDVLNLTRIESGRLDYEVTAIPVEALLTTVEELIMPQLIARGLSYHRDPARKDARVAIWGDEEKVRQILVNVMSNAIRYTPASDGAVTVAYEADTKPSDDDAVVRISVSDTGRGIPADQLARIFEPFVQVERNLTEASQQGVGLGLAISRDLARGMGGDLSVRSVLGEGSTFTLIVPRASPAGTLPAAAPNPSSSRSPS